MSIIGYAIPAFYHALTQYLKKELVRLQKQAVSIIVPGTSYNTWGFYLWGNTMMTSFAKPFLAASFRTQTIRL